MPRKQKQKQATILKTATTRSTLLHGSKSLISHGSTAKLRFADASALSLCEGVAFGPALQSRALHQLCLAPLA